MTKACEPDATRVLDVIRRDGICVLRDFLSAQEVEAIGEEGRRLAANPPPFVGSHLDPGGGPDSFLLNLIPVRLTRHNGWESVPSFERIKALPIVKNAADGYLGGGWGTASFIYNLSKAPSADERFPLHVDVFEGHKCLKAYIYLNAGNRENGAFRYVPRSHKLARAALEAMYVPGTRMVAENRLPDLLRAVQRHPGLIADVEMRESYELLRELEQNPERSYDFVVSGGPGTVVLFDTVGVHGGGRVYSGERYIARYHFVDPAFVFRNLPDQLPPVKRVLSHTRRISRKLLKRKAA